jgi:hypothetical protein
VADVTVGRGRRGWLGWPGLLRGLRRLPVQARVALAAAVALIVAGVGVGVWWLVDDDGGTDAGNDAAGADLTLPSTTVNTGDLEVSAPAGWLPIPVPDLGFGVAVPPGWEAVVLSPEGLSTLADAEPAVPDFTESAHAAASRGSVLYAAGIDADDRVSDLEIGGAPDTGVTDQASLEAYARDLTQQEARAGARVEPVADAAGPSVRLRFRVGAGDEAAEGTETLVLGPDGIVWSVIVTSDDPAIHDRLVAQITDTLAFAAR